MRENLLNKKDNSVKSAEKYALRYFDDLRNHFSLTDSQLINLLKNCIDKLKKKNPQKKWWQIFQKMIR